MRPARPGRAGPGTANGSGGSKLHNLIGSIWGGQSVNQDFSNPGGHDSTDATFDASAQNPFTQHNFFDRLAGRPDLNNAYALNRATAAGALSDEQKLALYKQNLGHQEQDYQKNRLGLDLANLAQQQNASSGALRPSMVGAPSMSYDLAAGTPVARPALAPTLSPEEYKYMLGSQAGTIGIPGAQANNALAINSRIGSEAERPFVAPTSVATAEGGLSTAKRGAMEASYGLGYRGTPQGQNLYTQSLAARDLQPALSANATAVGNAATAARIPGESLIHLGGGMIIDPTTWRLYSASPAEKPGGLKPDIDANGKMTGKFHEDKGAPGRLDISTAGTISNPATGFSYNRRVNGSSPLAQPSFGVPFPDAGAPAGAAFGMPISQPINPGGGGGPVDVATVAPTKPIIQRTTNLQAPAMPLDLPAPPAAPVPAATMPTLTPSLSDQDPRSWNNVADWPSFIANEYKRLKKSFSDNLSAQ